MSSPAGTQSRFLSRWIPSSSRAGVFLSDSPGEVGSLRSSCSSVVQEVPLDDSFCSQFAPLPVTRSSSLDSVVPKVSEADPETDTSSSELDTVHNILRKAQGLPLIAKLEQLKQLQQRMQEQLKAHQLEQLQKLQTEQQTLMGMVHTGTAEYNQEKQTCHKIANGLQPLQTASVLLNAQHSVPWSQITHQQEAARALVSTMWDHQPSAELSRSGHSADEDPSHDEESLQFVIEGESMHRQDSETQLHDRPIRSANSGKTFEEMLEEQLKLENEKLNKNVAAEAVKVKRPFLRRGEGLSRFTRGKAVGPSRERTAHSNTKLTSCLDPPTSQGQAIRSHHQSSEPKKPPPKSTTSTNVVIQRKTAVLNKENNPQNKAVIPATKPAKAHVLGAHQGQNVRAGALQHLSKTGTNLDPQQKITRDAMVYVSKGKSSSHIPDTEHPRVHVAENSFEVWLTERGECWDKEHQRECVELGEFELLERAADELSFSSNSSFICTLLRRDRRRLSSTPVKSPQQPQLPGPVQQSATNVQQSLPDLPVDNMAVSMKQNVVLNRCSEDEDKIDEEGSDISVSSSSDFHQTAFGSSQPFSHCFQVSQAPPYNKHSYQDRGGAASPDEEEENNGDSTLVDAKGHIDFDDDDTWNEPDDFTCVSTKTDNQAGRALTRKVAKAAEPDTSSASSLDHEPDPPPTCQLVAKLFPALKPKPSPPPPVAQDTQNEQATVQSRLLRERLVELETEIERFKSENAVLSRVRKENEDVRETLRKERAAFQQKMADELAKFEEFKREESRKLQRDKKLFEKHAATVRARPDKQERDEIQSLKQQLNTLQEDLKKREARWTSTHHRLRQQIDTLSTENATLRDQVRMMEKLRLTALKNAEREKEKERGRSTASTSSSTTAQKRTQSKSPSCSIKSSSNNKRESPELQNPPKATVRASSARSAACNSKVQNMQSHKEPCAVADPLATSEGQIVPDWSDDSPSAAESSSEFDCSEAFTEQSALEQEDIMHVDGKIERVLPDGGRLIVFPNGTRKEMSADGLSVKVTFFNGDIKQVMPDQRVIYYYAGAQTTHTTYPDGMEVLQFPNNQIEKHFPDGRKEITFPDQTVKNLYPDGREESVLADGTIIQQNPDGSKEIQFNTGQRELHTADFKRREYPDGTVKTVYSDGRQETRYPTGRVRLKDPQGRVVMDTKA